ncbi:MAG: 1-acyl-sn-glycerol-3-phosphate acyltransferase [Bacteroidia bacterium]|nr:1-acyl-sn-glycerol-3-phosphate acyltransferase [Bacteroidia bacterium]
MLYRLLKIIFSFAVSKYFVRINVLNEDRIPMDKPMLLLPNHRSAFMDPIALATQLKRTTFFLARGESFNNSIMVKLFKRLKMIPIFRKDHNPEKTHQNKDIFRYCHKLMEEKGCLMIFPEGICQTKYVLAPLKTGAAKIALEAEHKNDYALDLHIVPVGINYSNPHRFRGNLTLNVGMPIKPKDYKQAYQEDAWKAVNQLTGDIDKELRDLIILFEDQGQLDVVQHIENLIGSMNNLTPLSEMDWFAKRRFLSSVVGNLAMHQPDDYNEFRIQLQQYYGGLRRLKVNQSYLPDRNIGLGVSTSFWGLSLLLVVGFPLFLLGFLLHIVPFVLTRFVALKVVKRVDFMGSVALALGVFFFTTFGLAQVWLCFEMTHSWLITMIFALSWPSLGLFAYGYLADSVKWNDQMRWIRVRSNHARLGADLVTMKEQLVEKSKDLVQTYIAHQKKGAVETTDN